MKNESVEMPEDESKLILYTTDDGEAQVSLMSRDGRIWLNQKQMAELFAVTKMNISLHIANILKEKELDGSVVKSFFTTAADGKKYKVIFYALEMILAVGFRVRGVRGTQFRQWATAHLSEYLVKGFTMDDARLKNPDGRPDYFDELLARIRDIRASEKSSIRRFEICLRCRVTIAEMSRAPTSSSLRSRTSYCTRRRDIRRQNSLSSALIPTSRTWVL